MSRECAYQIEPVMQINQFSQSFLLAMARYCHGHYSDIVARSFVPI